MYAVDCKRESKAKKDFLEGKKLEKLAEQGTDCARGRRVQKSQEKS